MNRFIRRLFGILDNKHPADAISDFMHGIEKMHIRKFEDGYVLEIEDVGMISFDKDGTPTGISRFSFQLGDVEVVPYYSNTRYPKYNPTIGKPKIGLHTAANAAKE